MASSAHNQPPFLQVPHGTTAAPPPTPSTQSNQPTTSDDSSAADVLSRLLHRLPPNLSLPSRRRQTSPSTAVTADATCPTLAYPNRHSGILAASQVGFFQLAGHPIPPQLARSAESDSLSLFDLPRDHKREWFPKNWPLGYDGGEDDDDDDSEVSGSGAGSFCLDSSCSTESTAELSLASLREFTRAMEGLGMELVDALSCALGFENPIRGVGDSGRACVMIWISEGKSDPGLTGRLYPYVIGLHYQIRCQKYALHLDSGRVSVEPQAGSILVTLGDIAQVWSNGKLKKVRGRPTAASSAGDGNTSRCVTMSLLVTLPLESTVHPLTPSTKREAINGAEEEEEGAGGSNVDDEGHLSSELKEGGEEWRRVFNSFCLEDYAWRVYHERLLFKDPLERYRC